MGTPGHIYILTNETMPGLVKIGRTSRTVEDRMAELSSPTGVPGSYKIQWAAHVDNHEAVENLLHRKLGEFRSEKEFFKLPGGRAQELVVNLLASEGIVCSNVKSVAEMERMRVAAEQARKEKAEKARQAAAKHMAQEEEEERQRRLRELQERGAKLKANIALYEEADANPDNDWPYILGFSGVGCFFGYLALTMDIHFIWIALGCWGIAFYFKRSGEKTRERIRVKLAKYRKEYKQSKNFVTTPVREPGVTKIPHAPDSNDSIPVEITEYVDNCVKLMQASEDVIVEIQAHLFDYLKGKSASDSMSMPIGNDDLRLTSCATAIAQYYFIPLASGNENLESLMMGLGQYMGARAFMTSDENFKQTIDQEKADDFAHTVGNCFQFLQEELPGEPRDDEDPVRRQVEHLAGRLRCDCLNLNYEAEVLGELQPWGDRMKPFDAFVIAASIRIQQTVDLKMNDLVELLEKVKYKPNPA